MQPSYYYSYKRYRLHKSVRPWLVLIVLFIFLMMLVSMMDNFSPGLLSVEQWCLNQLINWSDRDPRSIMRVAVPVMAWTGNGEDIPQVVSPGSLVAPLVKTFTIDRHSPRSMLELQVPLLAAVNMQQEEAVPVIAPEVAAEQDNELVKPVTPVSGQSLVAIYNTHTGETYALTDGTERFNGKRGGVVKVAATLGRELEEKYGIKAAVSDTINDANYNTSYDRSQETLRKLLEENPSVQVVLDIHRDAGKPRENSVVTVDGRTVAPILIIVGSDARAPFPTWRQNYDFARELADEINKQHPGLCLDVRIKEGRYNQFLHPRAILLEIGSVSNSTEEAVQTVKLLAGPLAELVKRCLDRD
ncbi:stage II sporulation protein P [Desulfotomaculum arcticum]|uniref:Stage II sporulation protein P n=1 Tax=Desulfotruncus arcticus DSM 17038 TaxID=1121424 RepID=A0A1I2XIV3_9FIRM|nr:stage II sporulation protein P [Desulfotruncus arcticus]SFH13017.1 stage II sporulation protein P [Desulfotomaculum arcticum] [Desulfotruncus arcticus DSM 17038]